MRPGERDCPGLTKTRALSIDRQYDFASPVECYRNTLQEKRVPESPLCTSSLLHFIRCMSDASSFSSLVAQMHTCICVSASQLFRHGFRRYISISSYLRSRSYPIAHNRAPECNIIGNPADCSSYLVLWRHFPT